MVCGNRAGRENQPAGHLWSSSLTATSLIYQFSDTLTLNTNPTGECYSLSAMAENREPGVANRSDRGEELEDGEVAAPPGRPSWINWAEPPHAGPAHAPNRSKPQVRKLDKCQIKITQYMQKIPAKEKTTTLAMRHVKPTRAASQSGSNTNTARSVPLTVAPNSVEKTTPRTIEPHNLHSYENIVIAGQKEGHSKQLMSPLRFDSIPGPSRATVTHSVSDSDTTLDTDQQRPTVGDNNSPTLRPRFTLRAKPSYSKPYRT